MKQKNLALIIVTMLSVIGASSLVFAGKPETQTSLNPKAIPVYLLQEFQPGEIRTTTVDVEGYSKIKITYKYPAHFLVTYSWGCEDPSSGQVAESYIFEIKPSAYVSGTHPLEIAGSKLIVEVENQDITAGTINIWLYLTP